jgi:hypothetical protein
MNNGNAHLRPRTPSARRTAAKALEPGGFFETPTHLK